MNSALANLAALSNAIEEEIKKAQKIEEEMKKVRLEFSAPIETDFDFKPEPKKFYAAASIKPKKENDV